MGCRWLEALLAIVVVVFTYWSTMFGLSANTSMWIVIVAGVVLLVHALFCDKCDGLCRGIMKGKSRSSGRRRRRK